MVDENVEAEVEETEEAPAEVESELDEFTSDDEPAEVDASGEDEPAEDEEPKAVPLAAVKAERERRQRAERESMELKQRLAYIEGRLGQQGQPKEAEEPDEEPDLSDLKGWHKRGVERALTRAEKQRAERDWNAFVVRARQSMDEVKEDYEDGEEMLQLYLKLEGEDRSGQLAQRAYHSDSPGVFGYNYAKRYLAKQAKSGQSALEKENARLKAELAKAKKGTAAPPPDKKTSIAGVQNKGAGGKASKKAAKPEDELKDIFDGR